MPWSIKDYKSTPEENTEINGIDLQEETAVTGELNNVLRQMMADIAGSNLVDFSQFISSDPNNALTVDADGNLYVNPFLVAAGTPYSLISNEAGNSLGIGTDGLLMVPPEQTFTEDWNDITGKPSKFKPILHGSTHEAGGTDPLAFAGWPVGACCYWYGNPNNVPAGFQIVTGCEGKFINGATSSNYNQTSGTASFSFAADVSSEKPFDLPAAHSHGFISSVSDTRWKQEAPYTEKVIQAGYITSMQSYQDFSTTEKSDRHKHSISGTVNNNPPYCALYLIKKV